MYNKSELALFYEKAGRGVCSHAYIVDGAAGIGKLEFALSCARALLCTGKTKPCGICQSCRKFSLGGHPDIHITGTGEKCAGVDDIRELIRLASVMPNDGDMQVFIIANAGKMRAGAQNALLKLFEEPPPTVTVFLLTETRNSLLPTLLSRGQRIHLDGMSPKEALAELAARCGGSGGEANVRSKPQTEAWAKPNGCFPRNPQKTAKRLAKYCFTPFPAKATSFPKRCFCPNTSVKSFMIYSIHCFCCCCSGKRKNTASAHSPSRPRASLPPCLPPRGSVPLRGQAPPLYPA